jgi:hypothetical protein
VTTAVEVPERMASLTAIPRSKSERFGLGAHGLDTVAFRFRPGWPEFLDQLLRNATHRASGGSVIFDQKPGGIVCAIVGGVLCVEGRLAPLLTGERESWDLRPASDVYLGEQAARRVVEQLAGVPMDGGREYFSDGEVARLDLAHEFRFEDSADGLAFLSTLAALRPALRKVSPVFSGDGTVETVYFRSPKRFVVLERVYDKGVESGSHPAGHRVRLEVQRRYPRSRALVPRTVPNVDLGGIYGQSVAPYAAHESVAVGRVEAEERLVSMVARGEMTIAEAERILGTISILSHTGRSIYADSSGRRRLAEHCHWIPKPKGSQRATSAIDIAVMNRDLEPPLTPARSLVASRHPLCRCAAVAAHAIRHGQRQAAPRLAARLPRRMG